MENTNFYQSLLAGTVPSFPPYSDQLFVAEREPFLTFDENSRLSFDDKSKIHCSLVALVEADYTFDKALEDRAARFLKNVEPEYGYQDDADRLVCRLVPSSYGWPSGFVESIATLLSSPHWTVFAAALSLLESTLVWTSTPFKVVLPLVESDLIPYLAVTFQSHALPISENGKILFNLLRIVDYSFFLPRPANYRYRGITSAVDRWNYDEMIFQKVVIPLSHFMMFLFRRRHDLTGELFGNFVRQLLRLLNMGAFHGPTLTFILASPLAMAYSSCLAIVEMDYIRWGLFEMLDTSIKEWKSQGPEVAQSGKRTMRALFWEGLSDTLEQKLKNEKGGTGRDAADIYCSLAKVVGSNVARW
ncbi:hypothetical protein BLNAU_6070 [Blattamonas nauphoetae]|uniref:Uncharacterized protein n=1 Tax=Blattamonas nauphoetae TaxID=2049346 RepID=A0ABQ9Y5Q8_9EUKA|nr:hypothetical protein BLNAU_6070 [Blattamonas nauphoetae]